MPGWRFLHPTDFSEASEVAFSRLEIGALLLGTLIVVTTSGDGRATWFKGVQLLAVYLVIAGSIYWMPVVVP